MKNKGVVSFLFLLLLTGCASRSSRDLPPFAPLKEEGVFLLSPGEAGIMAAKADLSAQGLLSWRELDAAVSHSLDYIASRPSGAVALNLPGLSLRWGDLAATLRRLRALLPRLDGSPALLAGEFFWHRLGPDFSATGYYEPTLEASRAPSAVYPHPLYRRPPELRAGVPYYTRHDIDRRRVLAGRGLELAWVRSETDAFFLQIQGSGRLALEDGTTVHVLFSGKNNQPYRSLGRILRDEGSLSREEINMFSLRRFLAENPHRRADLLDQNPSYVFFRESQDGPRGSMGSPLTPWVSAATDPRLIPHGALLFLSLSLPASGLDRHFHALVLPQDTGGAIKGRRLDLFCGSGLEAEYAAAHLDATAAVYVLSAKQ
ncbi:MAG: MltA domain-containing protein [Desulfovibrio sp.]|nr:MltA domain-containing protein [Desulfovibrio sp.]